jgi:sugar lactone lactonase YvrE
LEKDAPMTILSPPEIEVAHHGADIVGECPMWHPTEKRVYWVDTRRPALQRLEADGTVRHWNMPSNIGSFVFRRDGGVVAGLKQGFSAVDLETGTVTPILDPEPDRPENRLNDGRCDRRGRYWCGSRDPGDVNPGGSLFRLDPDFNCERMDTGFIVSNGMAFSPDDRTLVFGDSRGETMWRYDLDLESGRISNKRVFLSTVGLPWRIDGATFDSEGYYWCALIGDWSIGRFDPEGRLDRIVRLPVSHPTMCNFGGPDLDVLYVTSGTVFLSEAERVRQPLAGALFAVRGLGVRGLPEPIFGG